MVDLSIVVCMFTANLSEITVINGFSNWFFVPIFKPQTHWHFLLPFCNLTWQMARVHPINGIIHKWFPLKMMDPGIPIAGSAVQRSAMSWDERTGTLTMFRHTQLSYRWLC